MYMQYISPQKNPNHHKDWSKALEARIAWDIFEVKVERGGDIE